MSRTTYFDYWGKSGTSSSTGEESCHLLPYHSLDVAAVAHVILEKRPALLASVAGALHLDSTVVRRWATFFLAIHDIGKFSSGFQGKMPKLHAHPLEPYPDEPHPVVGWLLWNEELAAFVRTSFLTDDEDFGFLDQWAATAVGHHGTPAENQDWALREHFSTRDRDAAKLFVSELLTLFQMTPMKLTPVQIETLTEDIPLVSWTLAGLAVLCDWLGSDQRHFAFHAEKVPLPEYWEQVALPAARNAVDRSGVLPPEPATRLDFRTLFPALTTPTPLQTAVQQMDTTGGPQLVIVEDMTGAGKTEAAVLLANRFLASGQADGLYVALPTMATADSMFRRIQDVYRQLYVAEAKPSLVLAHAARDLSPEFQRSIAAEGAPDTGDYGDMESASSTCAAWLADNRKKALLAPVGVGTIDQALLGVLFTRHQALRLHGLHRKLLLVDEVHACDAYMNVLLGTLIEHQAATGGSTILLSATLPHAMKEDFVGAFSRGCGRSASVLPKCGFPAILHARPTKIELKETGTRAALERVVRFRLVHDVADVYPILCDAASTGKCVAWIRNTVGDALDAYRALAELTSYDRLTLFHARFALDDRLRIERRIVDGFGKHSTAAERCGQVVVATQVIEQSLDLDFDVMITDLAPIDLVLQRAGRLLRHSRDDAGNPISGPDQRGVPELVVLAPPVELEPDHSWYSRLLPRAAFVYEDHARLWLTARLLHKRKHLDLPGELRAVIEEVYGESSEDEVPCGLEARSIKAEGARLARRSAGRDARIALRDGYGDANRPWTDDEERRTRLGDPTTTLRLARWDGEHLEPWAAASQHPWRMSELSVARRLVAQEAVAHGIQLQHAVEVAKREWARRESRIVLVPLVWNGDDWVGEATTANEDSVTVRYSDASGLEVL